jgi:hypothetical protein
LDSWSDEWSEASRYDRPIFELDLTSEECDSYRRGAAELSGLDLRPSRFDDADLSADAAYCLGLAVVLYGLTATHFNREDPDAGRPVLKKVAELLTIAELNLGRDADASLKGRLKSLRTGLIDANVLTAPTRSRPVPKKPSSRATKTSGGTLSGHYLVVAFVTVLGLTLWFALRFLSVSPVPFAATYQDLLPVQTLVREPGHITARVLMGWGDAREPSDQDAAIALWERISREVNDPGLQLTIADSRGNVIADVVDGRARWTGSTAPE